MPTVCRFEFPEGLDREIIETELALAIIAAECTLTIDLIKNKTINWPRIESPEYIMTMGNSSPLDNSLRIANTGMIHLLMDEYGFRLEDATFVMLKMSLVRSVT